jgi:glycine cleavage system H lipoate-binding protein
VTAILVFCTIALFLIVDSVRTRRRGTVVAPYVPLRLEAVGDDFPVPAGIFVGAGHTWASLEADGSIRVGVDDFASRLLGRLDRLEVAAAGAELAHEDAAFVLHQGTKSVAFASPLTGQVTDVNTVLLHEPERLRDAPYDSGWLLRIRPHHLARELRRLRIGDEAQGWLRHEAARLGDFLARAVPTPIAGATLQDGGLALMGVMETLDAGAWERFESEFLAGR